MSSEHIAQAARLIDFSSRIVASTTVVGSPALAAETIIGSLAIPSGLFYNSGVWIAGWAAFTVGTSGTAVTFKVRQTSISGTTIVSSGALTSSAGNLNERSIFAFDASPGDGQVYKMTMQVTNGAAASTVSALTLFAVAV